MRVPGRRFSLVLVATYLAILGFACAKKSRRLYLPAEGSAISIGFSLPIGVAGTTAQTFGDVCHGTRAFLVSVSQDTSSATAWDYRLLLDTSGTLHGCASGPCSGAINGSLGVPRRVMFEGIDIAASAYATAASVNVLCRGIADSHLGMGSISASPVATPSPSHRPFPPQITENVSVEIPILRIGEFNPTFTAAGTGGDSQTSTSLAFSALRTAGGGVIVVGGGSSYPSGTTIYAFYPSRISLLPDVAHLSTSRNGGRVVAFLDSASSPALLFFGGFGGTDTGYAHANSMDVVRLGSSSTETYPSYGALDLLESRGFFLPRHLEAGQLSPAVAIVGGEASLTTLSDRYQFFFPSAPTDITNCAPGTVPGRPAVCQGGSGVAMGDGGHVHAFTEMVSYASRDRILISMGYVSGVTASNRSYLFDPETRTYSGPLASVGNPALAATGDQSLPSAVLSSNYVAYFSGDTTKQWGYFRVQDSTVILASGTSLVEGPRTATTLLDGRVLLVGEGSGDGQIVETYVPDATTVTAGTFQFLTRFDVPGTCTDGKSAACVRTLLTRSYQTAARIDASLTWINGSVVVMGGSYPGHATEIFIPAYACNGTTPVRPDGITPVEGVDYCDRGRALQPITDPEHPVKLAP